MNYTLFHSDATDMKTWISPESFGVHFYPKTTEDFVKLEEIKDWAWHDESMLEIRIWVIKDLVYFENEEDRITFLLRWL